MEYGWSGWMHLECIHPEQVSQATQSSTSTSSSKSQGVQNISVTLRPPLPPLAS